MLGLKDSLMGSLMGPSAFNTVVSQLSIITQTWGSVGSGGPVRGAGAPMVMSTLTLGQYYPIRQLSAQEIANSGGRYRQGDLIVEQITPSNGAGVGETPVGYTPDQLDPARAFTSSAQEAIYRLSGETSGDYELREGRFDDAFSYSLVLRLRETTP